MKKFLEKYSRKILGGGIFFYVALLAFFSFQKYFSFGYNALDLAIFNQVFWNSAHGRFFPLSIHPPSYLGDHFIPFIVLLLPFYSLFSSPLALLFIQSLALGLAAWPLYGVARCFLKDTPYQKRGALLVAFLFLLNPFLWNTNLFEFHIVSFLPLLFFSAFYFWQRQRFGWYLLFILLILSLREDMAFLVVMMSFLPFLEQGEDVFSGQKIRNVFIQKYPWIITPFVLAIFWFGIASWIIGYFNPEGSYKFLVYYQWLGNVHNFFDLAAEVLKHPILVLLKLLSLKNVLTTIVFFVPFLFLPWWGKKYLLLGSVFYLEFALNSQGLSEITYTTHYIAFFLPVLTVAALEGIKNIYSQKEKSQLWKWILKERELLVTLIAVAVVYNIFIFGPLGYFLPFFSNYYPYHQDNYSSMSCLLKKIPASSSVAASYAYLPWFSSRPQVYSLHYGFLGHKQLSRQPYSFPPDVDYYLIDFSDLADYELQFRDNWFYKDFYQKGYQRLQNYLQGYGVVGVVDEVVLFKEGPSSYQLVEKLDKLPAPYVVSQEIFGKKLALLNKEKRDGYYSFYWQALDDLDKNYFLKLKLINEKGDVVWQNYYPLAYYFPSSSWKKGDIYKVNYWWGWLEKQPGRITVEVVYLQKGYLTLDNWRRAVMKVDQEESLGEFSVGE